MNNQQTAQQFGFTKGQVSTMSGSGDKGGSLKAKLGQLEVSIRSLNQVLMIYQDMIRAVNEDIAYNKREVQMLRQEKEQLENVLSHKSSEVRKTL